MSAHPFNSRAGSAGLPLRISSGPELSPRALAFLLYGFVVVANISDVITSLQVIRGGGITAGQVLKSVVFAFLFVANLDRVSERGGLLYCYLLFGYFMAVELAAVAIHHDPGFLVDGFVFSTKALLPFMAYYWLESQVDRGRLRFGTLEGLLLLYVGLFCLNILVPVALGVSLLNYGTSGYTGFYNAGNELGAFIAFMLPITMYFAFRGRRRALAAVLAAALVVCGILTGAKTPLLASALSLVLVPLVIWRHFVAGTVVGGLLLAGPVLYVLTHLNDLARLLPENIFGRLITAVTERYSILEILLGVRIEYFRLYMEQAQAAGLAEALFGRGFVAAAEFMLPVTGAYKAAEMEAVDLVARYGLVGLTLVVVLVAGVFVSHTARDAYSRVVIFATLVLMLVSLLAGHVLGNAFCGFVIAMAYAARVCPERA
mgnify:CR=1 FL=1